MVFVSACVPSVSRSLLEHCQQLSSLRRVFLLARWIMARTLRCLGVASRAPFGDFVFLLNLLKGSVVKSFRGLVDVVSRRGWAAPVGVQRLALVALTAASLESRTDELRHGIDRRARACVFSQSATPGTLSAVFFFAARVLAGKMARTLRCLGMASRAPPDSFFVLPKSVLQKSFSIFLNVVSCRGRALPSGTCSSPWSCSLDSGIAYVGRGGAVSGKSRERNAM